MIVAPTSIRRWLPRFGLRTLMIAVTVICVLLGSAMFWYQTQESEYLRQLQIAELIQSCGGSVSWQSQVPKWLEWLPNQKVFERIVHVTCKPGLTLEFGQPYATPPIWPESIQAGYKQSFSSPPLDPDQPRTAPPIWLEIMKRLEEVPTLQIYEVDEQFVDDNLLNELAKLKQLKIIRIVGHQEYRLQNAIRLDPEKPPIPIVIIDHPFAWSDSNLLGGFSKILKNTPKDYGRYRFEIRGGQPEFDELIQKIRERLPNVIVDDAQTRAVNYSS